jgi:23S rRNA pseudouridine1911/1915/1917 synthase
MKIIYEDKDLLVINKPAGISVTELNYFPVHRLDKETSGILLIAKNKETLEFFQKQFQERKVEKRYIALVIGEMKDNRGKERIIKTLIGRSQKDRRKQKVYFVHNPDSEGKREAITKYKILQKFQNYTLIEVNIETGRKHQIRTHLAYLSYPIAGDKMYGFKNQSWLKELKRQFLHASYLKIKLPNNQIKEFKSELPEELKKVLKKLKKQNEN